MGKPAMVTRTISTTEVTVLCADIANESTCDKTFVLSGSYSDKAVILKAVNKKNSDENISVLAVKSFNVKEVLYGMPEETFLAHATVLPARK